jgi:hypothetical protein
MTVDPRLARLAVIADLLRDVRLADLAQASMARNASLARLQDLSRPVDTGGLDALAGAQADQLYQRWAAARRAEVSRALATQTADWQASKGRARLAFARSQVLARLRDQPS